MTDRQYFRTVRFRNYKAFKNFSVTLDRFNVLVGPNNAGKSTILGAFRILAEGMRRARARKPKPIQINRQSEWAYPVELQNLPVSTENVFTDYDDSEPAEVTFRTSAANDLVLVFPEVSSCYLICRNRGKPVRAPTDFNKTFPVSVGFVPVLGPVEHDEPLYQREAARNALLTHRASRNFRNIWYHFPDGFAEFQELIRITWPGMDVDRPEITRGDGKPYLHMFCPEKRYPREIYWAGFGFQVWCQMLTYALRARQASLLIIDEPDIYLHSDLQRQLLDLLQNLGPDILIATHSTEIISHAEPGDLLVVKKDAKSAKRIKDPTTLQEVFSELGSNLNPTLTQLAKTRRALFVEGKDFQLLSIFARTLDRPSVANRSDFAVIPVEGFNPAKVRDFSKGMELAIGTSVLKGVIFDRDYRSENEILDVEARLDKFSVFSHIHRRKEIENYLLVASALTRAIESRLTDQNNRTGEAREFTENIEELLTQITDELKHQVCAQYLEKRRAFEQRTNSGLDDSTITERLMKELDELWGTLETRLSLVPGKQIFAKLNSHLQEKYGITVSPTYVAGRLRGDEISKEVCKLVEEIEKFRTSSLS